MSCMMTPYIMLYDINKHFFACSPTTQPFVRRATTGATALTCTTHGALSSPSWNGLLLIKTLLSPQLDLGAGTTPTWYTPSLWPQTKQGSNELQVPSCLIKHFQILTASCYILKMECRFVFKLEVHWQSGNLFAFFQRERWEYL